MLQAPFTKVTGEKGNITAQVKELFVLFLHVLGVAICIATI
jgi:hypothetical protein